MGKIREDLKSIQKRDPACRNSLEVVFLYSGFHALVFYRIAHRFYKWRRFFIARFISQLGRWLTGIEIHPGATIGRGLFIDHGSGVVIGETTEIGDYCTLYQGVTLGGTGIVQGKRHPTLGDDVLVGAGAKVLGPFKVGDHAKVAAGAVVLNEVPPYATAVGVPAKIICGFATDPTGEKTGNQDVDQINIEDPIMLELCRLEKQMELMENKLKELEKKT
jgi:serine O-acetyltransferase